MQLSFRQTARGRRDSRRRFFKQRQRPLDRE